jgi:ubiquinone biosynthesis protein
MKISSIPNVYRNVNRWREILSILSKYGLADWISRFDVALVKGFLKNRDGQSLAHLSRETRIRLAIEELGPTFIKLGQILSTRPDQVGMPLAQELQKLQTSVACDQPEVVRETIESELGKPLDSLFADFDTTPLASASIGQAHRARLHSGDDVVVKVQHVGVRRRMEIDLDILSGLAQLAEKLPELESYRPQSTVAEFRRTVRREFDFAREARNLQQFSRNFARSHYVRIPRFYPQLSTGRVLTMEWLDGARLCDPTLRTMTTIDLGLVTRHGAEMYLDMIFQHGFYHGDPHPGNLVVLPDNAIGLLDFGMVARLDEHLREEIEDMLMAIVSQDSQQLTSLVMRLGSVPPGLDEPALSVDLAEFTSHYANQPIESFDLAGALCEMIEIIQRYRIVLPPGFAMLIKVLVMLEGTARMLQPNFSLMELLQPYQSKMMRRRLSPARQMRKARRIYSEVEKLAEVFPRRLREILQQVESGKFDVHLDHRGLEPSVNRLVLGLLTSSIFLGSSLMISMDVWAIRGASVPGTLGVMFSAFLGWRLLRAIGKSGRLDQRK